MLSVSDTGTGMTDEVKARLFEAFFTTKPKGRGTGLGLATCQTIVQQSGGHIGVYSELGKGTTFKVYFPRVEQPLDAAAGPIKTGPLPRGTETVMVVEDEPSVRQLACQVLGAQGYQMLSATNGQDGLQMAREHKGAPIRLVVTDVIMPLMGGKVMAEWLKTTYPDLKILFTSGYTDDAIRTTVCWNREWSSCPNLTRPQPLPAKCAKCWMPPQKPLLYETTRSCWRPPSRLCFSETPQIV